MVVFRCPTDAAQLCVKRVVGLPGETIKLFDGVVHVDGEVAHPPPWVAASWRASEGMRPARPAGTWRLAAGEYFVLGDNRAISADSRTWRSGPGLSRKLLVGRPWSPPF